jgi:hypothetical protein
MTEERPATAEALLRAGADVHAVNDTGLTPLHLVQDRRVLAVLVRHGAQLEARDQQGQTPLISHAVEQLDTGCVPVMEALLDAGADVNARDHAGKSALDYARIRQEREKIALLVARGADGPTGPFVELYPSSLDLLACTITMRLTRGTEQREVDAAIEIAFEPGVVGVSFVDNNELWFATYSNVGIGPRELRQVVRTDDAIAAARSVSRPGRTPPPRRVRCAGRAR